MIDDDDEVGQFGLGKSGQNVDPDIRFVDPKNLRENPFLISTLTPEQEKRARDVHAILREHLKDDVERWVVGFRRDQKPEEEIAVWEKIAAAYQKKLKLSPSPKKRKAIYLKLLEISMYQTPITVTDWPNPNFN